MIEIVSATRLTANDFWNQSPLGLSLNRLSFDTRLRRTIFVDNRKGLPELYNVCIDKSDGPDLVAFIHDDVWIDDFFLADRLITGLKAFDVIGVAGNRRRVPHQPSWAFLDCSLRWDVRANLSGSVAHGPPATSRISSYGAVPAECELLDGVLLAARKSTLRSKEVRFDCRFQFHLYDLDFSRTARERGLRLGTWPICITHQSEGDFGGAAWQEMYRKYIDKWGS
jgi:hypothetical protein